MARPAPPACSRCPLRGLCLQL
ncbi:MAG: hypothetical protein LC769_07555 [Chloroflexi bacterium]|nr:hypothetical protein [Chloroflexota bacterium]